MNFFELIKLKVLKNYKIFTTIGDKYRYFRHLFLFKSGVFIQKRIKIRDLAIYSINNKLLP